MVSDIPCALFKNHASLPPHTPINLKFCIDSNNYHINLINYAGAFLTTNTNGGSYLLAKPPSIVKMTSQDSQSGTANCIGVGVIDVWLYLYCEQYDDITNRTHPYDFINYKGVLKAMTQGVSSDSQIFQFGRDRKKIDFIALAFTQQQATIKNSLSDFGIRFAQVSSVRFSAANVANTRD